jgi:hypothetical protein
VAGSRIIEAGATIYVGRTSPFDVAGNDIEMIDKIEVGRVY